MSRIQKLTPDLSGLFNLKKIRLSLDIGSFYTRIMADGELVFNQPTCFLKDCQTESTLAIGDRAYGIWGKEPAQTEAVFPLKEGVAYNKQLFTAYLEAVLKELKPKLGWSVLNRMNILAAIPSGATSLDRKIYKQCLNEVGLAGSELINRTQALGANISGSGQNSEFVKSNGGSSLLILDIGDQTTELGLIAAGKPVIAKTFGFGGELITESLRHLIRETHELKVSHHHATRLKHKLPNLLLESNEAKVNLRGVDVADNLVTTRTIAVEELKPIVVEELDRLLHQLKRALSLIKSDRLVSALENGIYLTGGGSLLSGLDEYLTQKLKVNVIRSEEPFIDVVKGVSKLN